MKKLLYIIIALIGWCTPAMSQTYNAAYVKALYAKYPSVKSNLCPACKLWVNPYYKSIADTERHMPICEYELLTKANYALTAKLNIQRTPKKGSNQSAIFGSWHSLPGQANEDGVYTAANVIMKKVGEEIAKGHVNAWILNAFSYDSAILSDTYTFNAALEEQNQNVGTEIATENLTRKLLADQDVKIWGGTFGEQGKFTDGKVTNTFPAFYWKIIQYGNTTICYWMPNLKTETQAMLPQRVISYQQLVKNLAFDPQKILQ